MCVCCGLIAGLSVLIVGLVPLNWKTAIIVFEAVTAIGLLFNPAWFYRRMIGYALSAGLLGGALSGSLNINIGGATLSWEGGPSFIFYIVIFATIVYFGWAGKNASPPEGTG